MTADLFDRKRTAPSEQLRSSAFDQASAFENLWQNIRQTKVATAKGRSCAPEPHHKQTAYRHYRRKVRSFADDSRCLAALGAYRSSDRVKAGYIQDAGTFFNQFEEWEPDGAQEATMGEVDMAAFRIRAQQEREAAPDLAWHRVATALTSAHLEDAADFVAVTWQLREASGAIEVAAPNQEFVDFARDVWARRIRATMVELGIGDGQLCFTVVEP